MPSDTWGLVTYGDAVSGQERVGAVVSSGQVLALEDLEEYAGLRDVLDRCPDALGRLAGLSLAEAEPAEGARLLAPLRYPRKLLGAGANYLDHAVEMGGRPASDDEPWFFSVPPTTTVIGPGEDILIPEDPAARVDWEAELAVVVGAPLRHADADEARAAVLGYTILNDVSARGLSRREHPAAPAMQFDWLNHKGRNTFKPMGPTVVPVRFVPDPQDLTIKLWVNGVLKQNSSTSQMAVGVYELLSSLSQSLTLEPGDVVGTGSPAGVGVTTGQFLRPGDRVTIEIGRLGRLTNTVRAESR